METKKCTFKEYMLMHKIVQIHGGYREKNIISRPGTYTTERSKTCNADHKVLNVTETEPQPDGYRNGFQVDLVTKSICG